MTGKVGYIVYPAEIIVGCLRGSVLKFDLDKVVKKNRLNLGFLLKVMIVGSICVSVPCTLQLSYGS